MDRKGKEHCKKEDMDRVGQINLGHWIKTGKERPVTKSCYVIDADSYKLYWKTKY